ncbi:MAG: hypothetical protein ACREXW_01410 [Gammaproteobacteria bacterium]
MDTEIGGEKARKDELRAQLGLKGSRPVNTRRARLEKKGFLFERF